MAFEHAIDRKSRLPMREVRVTADEERRAYRCLNRKCRSTRLRAIGYDRANWRNGKPVRVYQCDVCGQRANETALEEGHRKCPVTN